LLIVISCDPLGGDAFYTARYKYFLPPGPTLVLLFPFPSEAKQGGLSYGRLQTVMDYIDRYYNQVRMHSTPDYKSPMEYEKQ
jgi:hypothetical protein